MSDATDTKPSNVELVANSNNEFTFDLFKKVATQSPGNIFFSPLSINVALSMTFAGAKGITADEMRKTLKLGELSDDDLHSSFNNLLAPILKSEDLGITFYVGNRMYVQNKFPVQDTYLELLMMHYLTTAVLVDFANQSEATRLEINSWVEEQTNQKITNLIAPNVLTAATRLVLVNAVYFKGDWKKKFNAESTHPCDFFLNLERSVVVDMMYQKGKFPCAWSQELGCSILELAYVNEKLSMLLVLPDQIDGLQEVEDKLDAGNLQKLVGSMYEDEYEVWLPKFSISGEMSLANVLSDLGMSSLFSTNTADLSGITGCRDLSVSAVLHKAFLEVNEEGSEAAAATAVIMLAKCAMMGAEFKADHPFLLMIRDVTSGAILFMGRVADPSKS